MSFKHFLMVTGLLCTFTAQASRVLVMDSGADIKHEALEGRIWNNLPEMYALTDGVDEDKNGLIDDYNGYNFVDMNNELIVEEAIPSFNDDIRKNFEFAVLYELYENGYNFFTQEMIDWFEATRGDNDLQRQAMAYGSFSHGTHVAGIVARNNPKAEIVTAKVLGSDTATLIQTLSQNLGERTNMVELIPGGRLSPEEYNAISAELKGFVPRFAGNITNAIIYSGVTNSRTANGSLGISLQSVFSTVYSILNPMNVKEADIIDLSVDLMDDLVAYGKQVVEEFAPNTLFVIASGNDGLDNDVMKDFPSSIDSDNLISVAASLDVLSLASFSNFGAKSVHVAAPGVGIYSSAPGSGNYVVMNGTSQAAPKVARLASMIVDENSSLTPGQVKQILMETSDKKEFLKGKVASGGIINENRALVAAQNSNAIDLEEAIEMSKLLVVDLEPELVMPNSVNPVVVPRGVKVAPMLRPSLL